MIYKLRKKDKDLMKVLGELNKNCLKGKEIIKEMQKGEKAIRYN